MEIKILQNSVSEELTKDINTHLNVKILSLLFRLRKDFKMA